MGILNEGMDRIRIRWRWLHRVFGEWVDGVVGWEGSRSVLEASYAGVCSLDLARFRYRKKGKMVVHANMDENGDDMSEEEVRGRKGRVEEGERWKSEKETDSFSIFLHSPKDIAPGERLLPVPLLRRR